MFNYTKAELSEIANKQNFIRDTLEKVVRLSEVLDYCSEENREEMLVHRQQITEDLKKYMQTQGYSLNPQSRSRHSLDSFVFTYVNLGGMKDNIKVEINYSLDEQEFLRKFREKEYCPELLC